MSKMYYINIESILEFGKKKRILTKLKDIVKLQMDNTSGKKIQNNLDEKTISGFGDEWKRFPQQDLGEEQRQRIFDDYFAIFPWFHLPKDAIGVDVGCGSGRWAQVMASRVKHLHLLDASADALEVAKNNLSQYDNVSFHNTSIELMQFENNSLDFAYSLGVMHHITDTAEAIRSVSDKLKSGAPYLIYLYYAFDNRPIWYRYLWNASELGRYLISRLPYPMRYFTSQVIAAAIYWPLARFARLLEKLGYRMENWPLNYYRDKTFYVMRTDALDRFGTQLEKRFKRSQIFSMLKEAGFSEIEFSNAPPFWCAVGIKT